MALTDHVGLSLANIQVHVALTTQGDLSVVHSQGSVTQGGYMCSGQKRIIFSLCFV